MNSLRDIIRIHVEDETLRDFLGDNFYNTSTEEKERLLNKLRKRGAIDQEINTIINAFLTDLEKNSPNKRKRKIRTAVHSALNILLTILIGYTVNKEYWTIIWFLSAINIIVNGFFIYNED